MLIWGGFGCDSVRIVSVWSRFRLDEAEFRVGLEFRVAFGVDLGLRWGLLRADHCGFGVGGAWSIAAF